MVKFQRIIVFYFYWLDDVIFSLIVNFINFAEGPKIWTFYFEKCFLLLKFEHPDLHFYFPIPTVKDSRILIFLWIALCIFPLNVFKRLMRFFFLIFSFTKVSPKLGMFFIFSMYSLACNDSYSALSESSGTIFRRF